MYGQSGILDFLCCLTLLSHAHDVVAVDAALLPTDLISSVQASTTNTYGGINFNPSNVFDRNPSTLPDTCNCCWSSDNETSPWMLVYLNTAVTISRIVIKGRSDVGTGDITKMLTGLEVVVNGSPLAHSSMHFGSHEVTVAGVFAGVTSLKFQRNQTGPTPYWYLTICELEIYLAVHLVSMNLVSNLTASSVASYDNIDFSEVNVFDRNPSRLPNDCDCCWSSNFEPHPWLLIVLKSPLIVNVIYVKGRVDFDGIRSNLDHLEVYVNDVRLRNRVITATNQSDVTVQPGVVPVRSLKFRRDQPAGQSGFWFLAICELEIYWIACAPGYYGPNCDPCGHCSGGSACDPNTGHCPGACIGHYQPPLCQTCLIGYYGTSCARCGHCSGNVTCDPNSGHCLGGCTGNYHSPFCQTCPLMWYGDDCDQKCGTCKDNLPCNNGICTTGCYPGYKDDRICQTACDHGTFGVNCSLECHCKNDNDCDHVYGTCPGGCSPGWIGPTCSAKCDHGTFGANCPLVCHCNDGYACNNVHGTCPGDCAPGWIGATCSDKCGHGTFGANCSLVCHCMNDDDCDHVHGTCPGDCAPGWVGATCSDRCVHGTFGAGCGSSCHCVNNTDCDPVNGICLAVECDPGWTGTTCSDESTSDKAVHGDDDDHNDMDDDGAGSFQYGGLIGGLVAGNLVLILVGVAITILIFRRRLNRLKRKYEDNAYVQTNVPRSTVSGDEYDTINSVDQGTRMDAVGDASYVNNVPK